ncbi:hypothetical protein JG687_00010044 [Phytophthora cactorum]|uniref:Uncharacterized protein n=1 Tax=Phytophthora cactorum TaxID=29920 RepID=A0A8T1U9J5_9STRA|nr:hypothetical protein JG687_00010044 [Phytophthora cactorum]
MSMDRRFGAHNNATSFLRDHGDVVPLFSGEVHESYLGVAESDMRYVMTKLGFHYTSIARIHGRSLSLYKFNAKCIELIHNIAAHFGEDVPATAPPPSRSSTAMYDFFSQMDQHADTDKFPRWPINKFLLLPNLASVIILSSKIEARRLYWWYLKPIKSRLWLSELPPGTSSRIYIVLHRSTLSLL